MMTTHDEADDSVSSGWLNRRTLLRGIAATGATTALGALLAACGSGGSATTAPKPAGGTSGTTAPAATTGSGAASAVSGTTATQAPSAGVPKKGGTIKAEINSDVANLEPMPSSLLVDRQVLYNLYDSLVAIDKDLKIIPSLAESWQTPDPKTYIFKLRQGVKYHDGTDFNADSVKWNIERYLTDKNSRRKSEIDSIQTVEVMDPSTVKFSLKAPFAPLLASLVDRAGMMVSQKAAEAGGQDFSRKPIGGGTGAFKFVEWVKDDHITMERNPTYWKKDASGAQLPYVDKVIYRPIVDSTVALTNLKTGDSDISHYVASKDYASVKAGKELVLQDTPGLNNSSVYLNTAAEPFNKKELRQAFAEALDRDQILKTVFFGVGQVGYGPISPPTWAYDPSFKPYGGNAAKAKEYLKAGGKPDGFTCEMKITAGSPETAQLAQLMKDQLAKAGITMNLVQIDFPTLNADQQAGKFQATLSGWSGRIDPDGNTYSFLHTGGSFNDEKYSNPQVDDLLDKARAATEQAQRKDLYQQMQKLAIEEAPLVYYAFGLAVMLTRPNVQGMQLYADQIMRFESGWLK
ncbi:MAG: ABC transporter substrate-binding protein [Chloroflexota bacterium]|nr:ABC transporter substrate-binding protein [Chloroflexota bacterium]